MEKKPPKQTRAQNLVEASNAIEEVQSSVAFYGITLTVFGMVHGEANEWQFRGEDQKVVFQFWPTTKNSLVAGSGQYRTLSGWEEAMHLAIDSYFSRTAQQPK